MLLPAKISFGIDTFTSFTKDKNTALFTWLFSSSAFCYALVTINIKELYDLYACVSKLIQNEAPTIHDDIVARKVSIVLVMTRKTDGPSVSSYQICIFGGTPCIVLSLFLFTQ